MKKIIICYIATVSTALMANTALANPIQINNYSSETPQTEFKIAKHIGDFTVTTARFSPFLTDGTRLEDSTACTTSVRENFWRCKLEITTPQKNSILRKYLSSNISDPALQIQNLKMMGAKVFLVFVSKNEIVHICTFEYSEFASKKITSICKTDPDFKIIGIKHPTEIDPDDIQFEIRYTSKSFQDHIPPLFNPKDPNIIETLLWTDYINLSYSFPFDKFTIVSYDNSKLILESATDRSYLVDNRPKTKITEKPQQFNCIKYNNKISCGLIESAEKIIGVTLFVTFEYKTASSSHTTFCAFNYFQLYTLGIGSICHNDPQFSAYPSIKGKVIIGPSTPDLTYITQRTIVTTSDHSRLKR